MKHHLHLLLAAGFGAMSIGAAAAVHDWTATRIGNFDAVGLEVADINSAGQVAGRYWTGDFRQSFLPRYGFLYTPGSSGGLVDLGSFGGNNTTPQALNASGHVAGYATTANGGPQGFVYRNGSMHRLAGGIGQDINDRGQVYAFSYGANNVDQGVIFHPAGPPTVLSVPAGSFTPFGGGINNRGQVFGHWSPTSGGIRTFFYDNGRMTDIGQLGGTGNETIASAMNGSGQIVGQSRGRPFLYSDGKMTEITGSGGEAVDINDRGQVVGSAGVDAFLYSDGQVQTLGGGSRSPREINELGQVVGFAEGSGAPSQSAFFYSDGQMTDLTRWLANSVDDVNPSLPTRTVALNDLGQIVMDGTLINGQKAIFVLTPIPEPSSYALMLAGLGTLAWIAWRKRGRSMGNRGDQTPQTESAA